MSNIKEIQYDKKGFTVIDSVDVEGQKHRKLPNSNPGTDEQFSYQKNPWDKSDAQDD